MVLRLELRADGVRGLADARKAQCCAVVDIFMRPWGDTRGVATLPFGRPRSSPRPDVRTTRSTRSFEDRSREPCADFTSARVREAPSCFLRPPICYFSGKGLPCALSHASDSTAAHCYATIAARRHIGTEPRP